MNSTYTPLKIRQYRGKNVNPIPSWLPTTSLKFSSHNGRQSPPLGLIGRTCYFDLTTACRRISPKTVCTGWPRVRSCANPLPPWKNSLFPLPWQRQVMLDPSIYYTTWLIINIIFIFLILKSGWCRLGSAGHGVLHHTHLSVLVVRKKHLK